MPPNMSTSPVTGHSHQTSQKFNKYAMFIILCSVVFFTFSASGGVFGDRGVSCSSGVCLPSDYNKMDMPGIKPIHIDTQMLLMEIYEVSETDFTVHVNMFMTFVWQDNRLNFTSTKETSVDVDEEFVKIIWTPDFYIYHLKEIEGFNGVTSMRGLTVKKEGEQINLIYSMEANVKFMCSMNFNAFPFQSNVCKFRLTSYTFTADQMVFKALTSKRPDKRLLKEKVRDYEVRVEKVSKKNVNRNMR